MAKIIIKITSLSGILSKINFKNFLDGATLEALKELYLKDHRVPLTEKQEKKIINIILFRDFFELIKTQVSSSIGKEGENALVIRLSDLENNINDLEFILTHVERLGELLKKQRTEISFDGPQCVHNVVLFIAKIQEIAGNENKLLRLELKNVLPEFAILEKLIASLKFVRKSIIVTQLSVGYNLEFNVNHERESFTVDCSRPFSDKFPLSKVMKLAAEGSQKRVAIDNAVVTLQQLRDLTPLVATNCSTSVRNLPQGLCFNSRPVETANNAKHVVHISKSEGVTGNGQLVQDCLASFTGNAPKTVVIEGDVFISTEPPTLQDSLQDPNIAELSFTNTKFDEKLFDDLFITLKRLPKLMALHFNGAIFTKQQRYTLINDILPDLRLTSLSFENCEFDEKDSEHIAQFIEKSKSLRKIVIKAKGFNPEYSAQVVIENNQSLVEFVDDAHIAVNNEKLKSILADNNNLYQFKENKRHLNEALAQFDPSLKDIQSATIDALIRNLTAMYGYFEALLQTHKQLLEGKRFKIGEDYPFPQHIQEVIDTLCKNLIHSFTHFSKSHPKFTKIRKLFECINKFFVASRARNYTQSLISIYFENIDINDKNRDFSWMLVEKSWQYPENDKLRKQVAHSFFEDSMDTFVHLIQGQLPVQWWDIFEKLCAIDLKNIERKDKIDLLTSFVKITFDKYLLPLLEQEYKNKNKVVFGIPPIDPNVIKSKLVPANIDLLQLYDALTMIWNNDVLVVPAIFTQLPPCDQLVHALMLKLKPLIDELLGKQVKDTEVALPALPELPTNTSVLSFFFGPPPPPVTFKPAAAGMMGAPITTDAPINSM